jgi:molecular chaperone GrpE
MTEENEQDDQNQNNEITLEKLQADLDSAMAGWKRTAADFENYKRRKEAEIKELLEFAKEVAVVKLLPTIDSLEQALRHMPEYNLSPALPSEGEGVEHLSSSERRVADLSSVALAKGEGRERLQGFSDKYQNWQKGIEVLLAQLDKTLAEMGVKKIEALGKKFDPHYHEAVREVESDGEEGMVVEELQSGFILNDKVIRPSQVVISKKVKS